MSNTCYHDHSQWISKGDSGSDALAKGTPYATQVITITKSCKYVKPFMVLVCHSCHSKFRKFPRIFFSTMRYNSLALVHVFLEQCVAVANCLSAQYQYLHAFYIADRWSSCADRDAGCCIWRWRQRFQFVAKCDWCV